MNDEANQLLDPPPYADADFRWTDEGFEIRFAVKDPRRLNRWFFVIALVLGMAALLSGAAVIAIEDEGRPLPWGLVAVAALLFGGAIASLVIALALIALSALVLFDGHSLFFGGPPERPSKRQERYLGYRIPLDRLRGLRLHLARKPTWDVSLSAPWSRMFQRRRFATVEAVTDEGVLRVLSDWGEHELRWSVEVMNRLTGLAPVPDRDDARGDPAPDVLATQRTMSLRDWRTFTIMAAVAAALLTLWSGWDGWRAYQSLGWPSTRGVVLASEDTPDPRIRYRYEVEGRAYVADNIGVSMVGVAISRSQQRQLAREHPPGSTVEVFYNDADFTDAALVTGMPISMWVVGFPFPVVAIGGTIWLLLVRPRPEVVELVARYRHRVTRKPAPDRSADSAA